MNALVVGGTGALGTQVCAQLASRALASDRAETTICCAGASVAMARVGLVFLRPIHPRIAQFACGLAAHDVVAPVRGQRRLSDSLATAAAATTLTRAA